MEPNCPHNEARGLSAGPASTGDATTRGKNEDTRRNIYMTLASSEKPRPLRQRTANGQGSLFFFSFQDHRFNCGTIKRFGSSAAERSKPFLAALQKKSHSTQLTFCNISMTKQVEFLQILPARYLCNAPTSDAYHKNLDDSSRSPGISKSCINLPRLTV